MSGYEDISPIANWVLLGWCVGIVIWFIGASLGWWACDGMCDWRAS